SGDMTDHAIVEHIPATGSCAPNPASQPNVPNATLTNFGRGCTSTPSSGACAAGDTCLATPSAPFLATMCIGQDGDVACPAPYTDNHVLYDSVSDNRSCDPCDCGSVSGRTCAGNAEFFTGAGTCTGGEFDFAATASCTAQNPPTQTSP